MINASVIVKELKKCGTPARAKASSWYFKTGKGEYGYGDVFFGVTVPQMRQIAKKYKDLNLKEIENLLKNKVHECRLTGLLILVQKYEEGDEAERSRIAKFYLSHTKYINNWDLVDLSSHSILGHYLLKRNRNVLYKLARSKNLWERRIAVISTFEFTREGQCEDSFRLAKILLKDEHDLMHKAVGWMLREAGKKCPKTEERFLKKYASFMPRTMLRYAIEKFPGKKRKAYLLIKQNDKIKPDSMHH